MSCATCVDARSVATIAAPALRARAPSGPTLRRLWPTLRLWVQRDRERRALAELGERMLSDIGLTRIEASREWRKPFWLP